jgi:hypothetical protein
MTCSPAVELRAFISSDVEHKYWWTRSLTMSQRKQADILQLIKGIPCD